MIRIQMNTYLTINSVPLSTYFTVLDFYILFNYVINNRFVPQYDVFFQYVMSSFDENELF